MVAIIQKVIESRYIKHQMDENIVDSNQYFRPLTFLLPFHNLHISTGWVGYGEARGSIAAFLFEVGGKFAKNGPGTKLQKVGGPGLAVSLKI